MFIYRQAKFGVVGGVSESRLLVTNVAHNAVSASPQLDPSRPKQFAGGCMVNFISGTDCRSGLRVLKPIHPRTDLTQQDAAIWLRRRDVSGLTWNGRAGVGSWCAMGSNSPSRGAVPSWPWMHSPVACIGVGSPTCPHTQIVGHVRGLGGDLFLGAGL
jgi:hypothetical protein